MQYKIPLQIENEDVIVLGLSLRQLTIIGLHTGAAYSLFKALEPQLGGTVSLIFAVPIVVIGIIIALMRIAEMTFLPTVLNFIRLSLNGKQRIWSQGTDSYSEFFDIGHIVPSAEKKEIFTEEKSFTEISEKDDFAEKLKNI